MKQRYYHGGVRGLKVGDRILPPSQTKTERSLYAYLEAAVKDGAVRREDITQRADRVYMTTTVEGGYLFASQYPWDGGGAVYEVVPEGLVTPDPDCSLPGFSWQAPSALIVAVVDSRVPLRPELLKAMSR